MLEWWNELTLTLQIFWGIGLVATGMLLIQLVMTLLGADDGGFADGADLDVPVEADFTGDAVDLHETGLQILSVRTVLAFMAGFGWSGVVAIDAGRSTTGALLIASGVGLLLMLMVFWLMRWLYSLRQAGNLDYRNAVGEVGSVYVGIPPVGEGSGQIQIVVQGRLATVAATNRGTTPIPSGAKVRVTGLGGANILEVEGV